MRRRRILLRLCLGSLVLLVARLSLIRGVILPIRIASGSMAESLLGPHFVVQCGDCQFTFRCGVDWPPLESRVVCPNCGFDRNTLQNQKVSPGDRVWVDRWPTLISPWKRWDIVAFRSDDEHTESVKRVVGLPGEQIAIENGNIFVQREVLAKDWQHAKQLAVLVHDNRWQPSDPNLPQRWRPLAPTSGWQQDPTTKRFRNHQENQVDVVSEEKGPAQHLDGKHLAGAPDWLEYHHWRCFLNPTARAAETTILDNDSYNQGSSRQLNEVDELMIAADVDVSGDGKMYWRIDSGSSVWTLEWCPAARASTLKRDETEVYSVSHEMPSHAGCKFAVIDNVVWWEVADRVLISHRFNKRVRSMPHQRLAIGAHGATVCVSNLRVYRDVYYLNAVGTSDRWSLKQTLGPEEYFVLGDNPIISVDSRSWHDESLQRDKIVGRVEKKL